MKLFTVGPVEMFPETLDVSGRQLPYFRTERFSEILLESERLIKEFSKSDEEDRCVFLTCSGTGAMEAAITGCFSPDDKLLVISGGSFGRRFCEICDVHGIPYTPIEVMNGEKLTEGSISKYDGCGYTGMLVNVDETSTGQLYDMKMISEFCKRNGMYLIADAISAFLADNIEFKGLGIDVMIVSSQKALSLSPGLSMLVLSRRIIDERISKRRSPSLYFDLNLHMKDGERGQTPFTPAVGTILELNAMLHAIQKEGGVDKKVEKTHNLALYFRNKIKGLALDIPAYPLSNAVTPILFRNGGAYDVHIRLMEEKGLVLTPSGGDLRDRMLRVSHIGNLREEDYDYLTDSLREILR